MESVSVPLAESREYRRRDPQQSVLWQVVQEHLNTFLEYADSRSEGKSLPVYVKNTFRNYLKCGILACGFCRVRCSGCGHNMLVAFSCKGRGICPSCEGRRMADTAAHLVDHVFPEGVPARQWVLSVPQELRYILARDCKLLTGVLQIFVGEIFKCLKRAAGLERLKDGQYGAVTAVQRFGGFLNLNCHLHVLVLDGVYVRDAGSGELAFRRVPAPEKDELERVLLGTQERILKYLGRQGIVTACAGRREDESVEEQENSGETSLMDVIQAASIRGWVGLSPEARQVQMEGRVACRRWACPAEAQSTIVRRWVEPAEKPFTARSGRGWSVEAGVRIKGCDREGLERVCRYILRPPFAEGRLERLPDGRIRYEFRRAWADGSVAMVMEPVVLLEKLAALIPPPRSHLLRYHGVLGPHARARSGIVPPEKADSPEEAACDHDHNEEPARPAKRRRGRRKRLSWAALLKRTFGLDVLVCPKCGGRMKVIACIDEAEVARKILLAMGLSAEIPRAAPARPPPQSTFEFDQAG